MSALALVRSSEPARQPRRHVPREEYYAWLHKAFGDARASIKSRRYFYNRFVGRWPDLESWFSEPLLVRLDLHERQAHEPGKRVGPSQDAGPYIAHLALVERYALDADFVLSRNWDSLFDPRVAAGLGLDLEVLEGHIARMQQLGYAPVSGRSVLTWAFARLVLWRGDPDIRNIRHADITAFADEIRRYCACPEAGFIRASHVANARRKQPLDELAAQFEKACLTRLYGLHVLLFNIGQVTQVPIFGLHQCEVWLDRLVPADLASSLTAPVRRWLSARLQTTDRAGSVRHARDAFRYFLRWLADVHPEVRSLRQLTRLHLEEYLAHTHDRLNPRNGRPLHRARGTATSARSCSSSARPANGAGTTFLHGPCWRDPTCQGHRCGYRGSFPARSSTG